jgi:hypothetical protein
MAKAVKDQITSQGGKTFQNQSNSGGSLSKAQTVAQGVLSRSGKGAAAAAAAARATRVFQDQLVGRRK